MVEEYVYNETGKVMSAEMRASTVSPSAPGGWAPWTRNALYM